MRTNQIVGHVPGLHTACLSSGSCDKRERKTGGDKNNNLSVKRKKKKKSPDAANTKLTAAVNNSHNKGYPICFQECV